MLCSIAADTAFIHAIHVSILTYLALWRNSSLAAPGRIVYNAEDDLNGLARYDVVDVDYSGPIEVKKD